MVLVASGRERRRRSFVAALFAAVTEGEALATASPGIEAGTTADALVARLFREEGRSLVRLARMFTDDRNAAEDLVQEAFIRLHRAADRINDPGTVTVWDHQWELHTDPKRIAALLNLAGVDARCGNLDADLAWSGCGCGPLTDLQYVACRPLPFKPSCSHAHQNRSRLPIPPKRGLTTLL